MTVEVAEDSRVVLSQSVTPVWLGPRPNQPSLIATTRKTKARVKPSSSSPRTVLAGSSSSSSSRPLATGKVVDQVIWLLVVCGILCGLGLEGHRSPSTGFRTERIGENFLVPPRHREKLRYLRQLID